MAICYDKALIGNIEVTIRGLKGYIQSIIFTTNGRYSVKLYAQNTLIELSEVMPLELYNAIVISKWIAVNPTLTPPKLVGAEATVDLATLQLEFLDFLITLNNVSKIISVDARLTNTYEGIAKLIQAKMNEYSDVAFKYSTCTYNTATLNFTITSGAKGQDAVIGYAVNNTGDSADLLGLSELAGATIIAGTD